MRINFEKELPDQLFFLLRDIPKVSLKSIGKIPYTVKTLHNLMSIRKIERIRIGANTAMRREDLVKLLNQKLNPIKFKEKR